MAAMLIAALGWPSAAGATSRVAPEAEQPPELAPAPTPEVELTPEERRIQERRELAARHWQEGERHYQNGRYAEAAVEFERSYAAVPAADTLYSQALSYERAGRAVEAVGALKRYLAHPDCEGLPTEERTNDCTTMRAKAEEALAEQRLRVGELELSLGEGVRLREVRVDGRVVPLADFPLLLLPGTYDVEVFGPGPEERRTRTANITGGEQTTIYVAPFETKPTVKPDPDVVEGNGIDVQRQRQRTRALEGAFWAGTGLTALSTIAVAVTGGLTRYHQQRYHAELCAEQCWEKNLDGTPKRDETGEIIYMDRPYPAEHEAKYGRYKPATSALVGVTVGLSVATALLGTFAFRKPVRERAGTLEARVRPRVRLGATGLVVRW